MKNRLIGLDWLRGFCAISIMFFHFGGGYDKTNTLMKLGIYGVSIFFILSGLSMAIVYNSFFKNINSYFDFFRRRIFRIVPLHFIACILMLGITSTSKDFDILDFILNITMLFGFIDHDNYIVVGAWSIGNEMVYYSLTPFVIILYNKNKIFGNIILLISTLIGMYFAFSILDSNKSIESQWSNYINPLNNLFLFIAGIALYYNFENIKIKNQTLYIILILSITTFLTIPYKSQLSICTGIERISFCLISILLVLCFYKIQIKKNNRISYIFEIFGISTYGVYILHPIINDYLEIILNKGVLTKLIAVPTTILIAILSYYYFEKKIIEFGKKLIGNV